VKKTLAALLCAASVVALEAAKIKVKAEPDPTYDFSTVRTWAWDAEGDVIMARTPTDDPVALKARLDPLIRKYVAAEMAKRGLAVATGAPPDVHLHYYVLVTVASSGQEMGQFLPAVPYWGAAALRAGDAVAEHRHARIAGARRDAAGPGRRSEGRVARHRREHGRGRHHRRQARRTDSRGLGRARQALPSQEEDIGT
jgi:hypothetical protein